MFENKQNNVHFSLVLKCIWYLDGVGALVITEKGVLGNAPVNSHITLRLTRARLWRKSFCLALGKKPLFNSTVFYLEKEKQLHVTLNSFQRIEYFFRDLNVPVL